MDIILQMKINLVHINETLAQQTYEIREQLALVFDQEQKTLQSYVETIDEKLRECAALVVDYQRKHAALSAMRDKLVQLGAEPSDLAPQLTEESIEMFLAWRVRELRDEGRL